MPAKHVPRRAMTHGGRRRGALPPAARPRRRQDGPRREPGAARARRQSPRRPPRPLPDSVCAARSAQAPGRPHATSVPRGEGTRSSRCSTRGLHTGPRPPISCWGPAGHGGATATLKLAVPSLQVRPPLPTALCALQAGHSLLILATGTGSHLPDNDQVGLAAGMQG